MATAVWNVVESRDMVTSIGFWCDNNLPGEHGHVAPRTAWSNRQTSEPVHSYRRHTRPTHTAQETA